MCTFNLRRCVSELRMRNCLRVWLQCLMQVIRSFLDWENQSGWNFTSSSAISFANFMMCVSNFDRAS